MGRGAPVPVPAISDPVRGALSLQVQTIYREGCASQQAALRGRRLEDRNQVLLRSAGSSVRKTGFSSALSVAAGGNAQICYLCAS